MEQDYKRAKAGINHACNGVAAPMFRNGAETLSPYASMRRAGIGKELDLGYG